MPRRQPHHRATGAAGEGRLLARPGAAPPDLPVRGEQPIGLARGRDGLLYVPASYDPDRPGPLVVMLHGAGGEGRGILPVLRAQADEHRMLLLAPDARGPTWDVIRGGYGPDVTYLDSALADAFRRYAVDPARIAVSGFSDGASYALSLGVANGALFTHAIAFSPGFMAPAVQEGRPRIFVSHGTRDTVLPIAACSRRVVPELLRAGYDVRYVEFEGGHSMPPDIVADAVSWLVA